MKSWKKPVRAHGVTPGYGIQHPRKDSQQYRREAPGGSRDCVQPARTLRTRLNAEAGESPTGVAHEPVGAMTEGQRPRRRWHSHLPNGGSTEVGQRVSGHLAAYLDVWRPARSN